MRFKGVLAKLVVTTSICLTQTGQTQAETASFEGKNRYQAQIKITSYGIPHIEAADFGSLGYGEGYVAAKDHVCNIALSILQVKGEMAEYLGPGERKEYLVSDLITRALDIPAKAADILGKQGTEIKDWVKGYAAGYNRRLNEGENNSWCKDSDWLKEIHAKDVLARVAAYNLTIPRMGFLVANAEPPKISHSHSKPQTSMDNGNLLSAFEVLNAGLVGRGSNAWAIGRELTENGRGILLANPHFPWYGTDRMWEKHLTIPGKINIYGTHIVGMPGVSIGFNEAVGWTHTVSSSQQIVAYKLKLVPGDPTSYYYDDQIRKMTPKDVEVKMLSGSGQPTVIKRTVWFSHYGPIVVLPGLPWNDTVAYTIRDANENNDSSFAQWKDMAQASNVGELIEAHRRWNAMPWVNTVAVDKEGQTFYTDGSNVGNLSNEAITIWQEKVNSDALTKALYKRNRIILLNGSDSRFEWQSDVDNNPNGVVPYSLKPAQTRLDYVFNANDSYWLTNPLAPMTGYSPLFGEVETPRSLRTRMNIQLLNPSGHRSFAGRDSKFSLREVQQAIYSNRSLSSELLKDQLAEACFENPIVQLETTVVDLKAACQVLSDYRGSLDLDAKGAILFREWIASYPYSETYDKGRLFASPFKSDDPTNTPHTLANSQEALRKLANVVVYLSRADINIDSSLRDFQFAYRDRHKIAIHGGGDAEGVANIIEDRGGFDRPPFKIEAELIQGSQQLSNKGYLVSGGTSFLLSLSFSDHGPVAEAILTYGQSGDPNSDHFIDQTELFAQKKWRPALFNEVDISNDIKEKYTLVGPREGVFE